MAALKFMGKWGFPVATAVAVPLFVPVVSADSGSKEPANPTSRMLRPSELPIYDEPEEVLDFEYHGRERSSLEEGVGAVRHEVEGIIEATRSTREKVVHICETGKAHTLATVDYITDEENVLARAGAITIGGLAGLVLGARKRGIVRKVFYTSTGVAAAASLCYPRQAYQISQTAYAEVKDYANIGYNFVAGVKPQSKVPIPDEPKSMPPAEPVPETEVTPSQESPPAEADTSSESEGNEVRNVLPQTLPDEKSSIPVGRLAQQASEVMQWGFKLTDKTEDTSSVPTVVHSPPEPSVPEGFGTFSLPGNKDVENSSSLDKIEESLTDDKVTDSPDAVPKIIETVVEDIGDKIGEANADTKADVLETDDDVIETAVKDIGEIVGEDLVEDTANIIHSIAEETLKNVTKVAEVADKVEKVTDNISSVIDVVQEVLEAADKDNDGKSSVVSDVLLGATAVVIEGVEIVVDSVNFVAGNVEELAEKVAQEVKDVVDDAAELIESEVKREEMADKIVECVKEMVSSDADEEGQTLMVIPEKDVSPLSTEGDMHPKLEELSVETFLEEPLADLNTQETAVSEPVAETLELGENELKTEVPPVEASIEEKPATTFTNEESSDSAEAPDSSREGGLFGKLVRLFVKEDNEKVSPNTSDTTEKGPNPEDAITPRKLTDEEKMQDESELKEPVKEMVVPLVENVAEDLVEMVGEVAVEKVAETVVKLSTEIEEDLNVFAQTASVTEKVSEEASSILEVTEGIAEGVAKAAEAVPEVPKVVDEVARGLEEIAEETETLVNTVNVVADRVETITEEITQDTDIVEAEAQELIDSEEKRKELVENVIDAVGDEISESLGTKPIDEKLDDTGAKREGLFDKLLNFLKEKGTEEVQSPKEEILPTMEETKDKPVDETKDEVEIQKPVENIDLVEEMGEVAVEKVAEIVEVLATEVEEVVNVVTETAANVETASEEAVSVIEVTESIAEAVTIAAEEVPELPKLVEEVVSTVEEIAKESEAVLNTVIEVADKVKEIGEEIKEDVKEVEMKAEELIESEEKREELVENIINTVTKSIDENLNDTVVKNKKEGLFDKLVDFLKEKPKEEVQLPKEEILHSLEETEGKLVDIETKVEDVIEKMGEVVVEEGAETAKVLATEVEEGTDEIIEAAAYVDKATKEAVSVINVAESIAKCVTKAGEAVPEMPEIVEEVASTVEEIAKESEGIVDTVTVVADKVKEIAEDVKQEAEVVEAKAVELIESEEKRKELVDNVIDFVTGEISGGSSTIEKDEDRIAIPDVESQGVEESSKSVGARVDDPVVVEKEGLFNQLISFLKEKGSEEDSSSKDLTLPTVEESKEESVSNVTKVDDIETQKPMEEVEIQMATEVVEVQEATELLQGIVDAPSTKIGHEAETHLSVSDENQDIVKDSKENVGLVGKLIDLFSKDEIIQDVPADDKSELQLEKGGEDIEVNESCNIKEETLVENLLETTTNEQGDQSVISEPSTSTSDQLDIHDEKRGVIGKLIDFISRDEKKLDKSEEEEKIDISKSEDELPHVKIESETNIEEKEVEQIIAQIPEETVVEPEAKEVKPEESKLVGESKGLLVQLVDLISGEKVLEPNVKDVIEPDDVVQEPVIENENAVVEPVNKLEIKNEEPVLVSDVKEISEPAVDVKAVDAPATEEKKGLINKLADFLTGNKESDKISDMDVELENKGKDEHGDPNILVESNEELKETVPPTDFVMVEHADVEPEDDVVKEGDTTEKRDGGLFGKVISFMSGSGTMEETNKAELATESGTGEENMSTSQLTSDTEDVASGESIADIPESKHVTLSEVPVQTPTLEIKDESLFSRLSEFVSGNDKKSIEESAEESNAATQETTTETSQEFLPQPVPKSEDGQEVVTLESSVMETKPSLFDRVANIFSNDNEPLLVKTEQNVEREETVLESSSKSDSEEASNEDEDVFVVLSKPSSPVETSNPEEGQQEAVQATGWLPDNWFRSNTSVTQEGKDVIIQVAPEKPEKDYGQSHPEDSDMYTTRS